MESEPVERKWGEEKQRGNGVRNWRENEFFFPVVKLGRLDA